MGAALLKVGTPGPGSSHPVTLRLRPLASMPVMFTFIKKVQGEEHGGSPADQG